MTNYIERYWRDATPEDAINEPPMVARFRYEDAEDWEYDLLVGWDRTDQCHWRSKLDAFEHCQVYDAPDPGEGWRLIEPDQDDYNQNGIEYWNRGAKLWLPRDQGHDMTSFCSGAFYRIRIEPPKPKYEPFRWEDREQLRGRWIGSNDGRCQRSINTMHNDNGIFYLCAINAESLCTDWHFIDTREPVGKRVQ